MFPSCASSASDPAAPACRDCSSASALFGVTRVLRIWPPSSPISIRTKSFALVSGNHLREDAVDSVGMDECDFEPEEAGAWDLVDQLRSLCLQVSKRLPHVGGLEGDVMHRLASPCQEAPDRSVLPRRREELDTAVAHEERCRFDPLRLQRVTKLDARAEEPLVGRNRLVEISNGHADVVDAPGSH